MKKIEKTYKKFKSEQDIIDFFAGKPIHCVSCKEPLTGNEDFDHELSNALAIPLEDSEGNKISSVPRIVCDCGYKNTVLKLLYQTV